MGVENLNLLKSFISTRTSQLNGFIIAELCPTEPQVNRADQSIKTNLYSSPFNVLVTRNVDEQLQLKLAAIIRKYL